MNSIKWTAMTSNIALLHIKFVYRAEVTKGGGDFGADLLLCKEG
ncbi:hypothetical protein V7138_01320 [Bacillus sp. JJ1533]